MIVSQEIQGPKICELSNLAVKRDMPGTFEGQYSKTATRCRSPSCRDLNRGSRAVKVYGLLEVPPTGTNLCGPPTATK